MKIILNPAGGAPIKDVQVRGQILFKETPFEIDSLRKIENDGVAEDLLSLFEFLMPLTLEEAKSYKEGKLKRKFKCEKCDFTSDEQISLSGHTKKHDKEEKLDKELGIEVIESNEGTLLSPGELEQKRLELEKRQLEAGGISSKWEDERIASI